MHNQKNRENEAHVEQTARKRSKLEQMCFALCKAANRLYKKISKIPKALSCAVPKPQVEQSAEKTVNRAPKKVIFSSSQTLYTYPNKKSRCILFSIRKISDSYPPRNIENAMRLKGSSKETPLAKKVLANLEKRAQALHALKEILQPDKKKPKQKPQKAPKSKILSILDGYSEASVSDAYLSPEPEDVLSEDIPAAKIHTRKKNKPEKQPEKPAKKKDPSKNTPADKTPDNPKKNPLQKNSSKQKSSSTRKRNSEKI